MIERFLVDTCAIIWFVEAKPLLQEAAVALSDCRNGQSTAYFSAMSAWEVGMLISKGRLPTAKNAMAWFDDAKAEMAVEIVHPSLPVLVASSFLPPPIHSDPMDRIIIATAREHDLTIITRDRAILAYGAAGHVKTLAC